MANKKKIAAIGGVSVAAVAAVAAGAFAFFSDTADGQTTGTAGTVDASISNALELENAKNINPGDDDPKNPDDAREGTQHKLSFSVRNDGNKSIMTRNIITLSVKAGKTYEDEGISVGDVMNPAVYSLLVQKKGEGVDAVELVKKYYTTDADITDGSKYVEFTAEDTANLANGVLPTGCTAIRYITQDIALNGNASYEESGSREVETDAEGNIIAEHEEKSAGAVVDAEGDDVDYNFYLMLEHFADDTYELSGLTIDLEVQAMQYRNTNSDSWNTIFKDTVTAGGGAVTP